MDGQARHRVVIIGGGFGGLYAARNLRKAGDLVDVTLIDRRNHHLFQPMLYQVATGALSPGEIAQPLRSIFRRQRNTRVLLGEAVDIDAERREVRLSDGAPVRYDTLVVATGAHHAYFGHDDWAAVAPGLKTIDDAIEIRRRILIAFEAAEREADPDAAAGVDDVRARGRRPDRGGAGGRPRRDRERHPAQRLPLDPPAGRPDRPRRGDGSRPAHVPARPVGVGAPAAGAARRRRPDADAGRPHRGRPRPGEAPRRLRGGDPRADRALGGGRARGVVRAQGGCRHGRRDRPQRPDPGAARPHDPRAPRDLRGGRRGRSSRGRRIGRRRESPRAGSRAAHTRPRRSSPGSTATPSSPTATATTATWR